MQHNTLILKCGCGETCQCGKPQHVAPAPQTISIDGIKDVGINIAKLGTSVKEFPKNLRGELNGALNDSFVIVGLCLAFGLIVGLLLGALFARGKSGGQNAPTGR